MPTISRPMRGLNIALILVTASIANGLNDCFNPESDQYGCEPGSSQIDLDNCGIEDEELGDLAACFDNVGRSTVEVIAMNSNSLWTLPGGEESLFAGFDILRTLMLNQNNIETINVGSFEGLGALTYLGIIQNKLTTVPVGGFDGLAKMEEMTLYGNDLAMLPVGVFRDLEDLQKLSLGGNALTTLPAGLFDGLVSLVTVDLSENDYLECVPSLDGSPDYTYYGIEYYRPEGFVDGGICSCPEEGEAGACTPASSCVPGEDGYTCTAEDSDLVDARMRTTVSQSASAYDTRLTEDGGCDPDGCTPALTRDQSLDVSSRWSCSKQLSDAQCTITYEFEEPQDIDSLRIKFHKGDERIRTLKVQDNTGFQTTITSSGTADGYESFDLYTDETSWMRMESLELGSNEWISITEVEFMVD